MKVSNAKTTTGKPAGSPFEMPNMEAAQAFHGFAGNGVAQAQANYEKMSAATAEASNLIKNSCSTAAKGAMEYNAKLIEIAWINANAAFEYASELNGVRSPAQFVQLTTEHARKRFDLLSAQTGELAALAQKLASDVTEPLKAGATNAFRGQLS